MYPRVPGHEVVGVIDEAGAGVTEWKKGDRVGVGWHGGHDFVCPSCRRGDFVTCANEAITGITRDGGYAQYMLARHEAVALLPDGLDGAEAGPLMCAGITTFNALRNSGARAGDLVGVLGIGGLGHLGIQYAAKSGYRVVGVGRGPENAALAKKLGAFAYIDSKATKPAEELQKLGGAKVILATAPRAKAIADSSAPHITGGDRPTSGVRPGAGILRYPISATAAEKPLPRKGQESFPSWTSPVRPRSPALVKTPSSRAVPWSGASRRLAQPTSRLAIQWSSARSGRR